MKTFYHGSSAGKVFGYILAATTILFWGITFVSTKYLLADFSSAEILFFRVILAFVGLWIIHPKTEKIQMRDNILFALAALTGIIFYQLMENIAIHFTNASNVSVIVSICPLFTAIISQIFLKEKHLTFWFILGFFISITGVTLVCLNGSTRLQFNPKGDVLALLSAISWGFYSMIISIINRRKYDPICSTRRIFFFAVLFMAVIADVGIFINANAGGMPSSSVLQAFSFEIDSSVNAARFSKLLNWVNLLFLGVVASGLCFVAWNKACQIVGTVKISCGLYLISVVTIVFAFFALGEKITPLGAAGAIITIAGLFISEKK
ncbi:MAG: DMT family transporter [Treponema sp.]|nr:DMT family transporter [Treponema sp.]